MFGLVVSMNCVSKTNILNTVILNAYRTGSRTVIETLKVMHRYFLCSRQEEKTNNSFKRSIFIFFRKFLLPEGFLTSSGHHHPTHQSFLSELIHFGQRHKHGHTKVEDSVRLLNKSSC